MSDSSSRFSLVGAVVLVVAVLITLAILLPILGTARRSARGMQQNTQVRGIHQSLVMYARSNGGYYPGFDSTGTIIDATVESRYKVLLEGRYFTGEYMISPAERKVVWGGEKPSKGEFHHYCPVRS